jgi:polysaccharide biosynthesis protein PslA
MSVAALDLDRPRSEALDRPAAQPADSGADRRGPFRPRRLLSARARLNSYALAWMFKAGDGLILAAGVLIGWQSAGGALAQTAGYFGCAWLLWRWLKMVAPYRFGRRESLPLHLARIALAFGGAAATLAVVRVIFPELRAFSMVLSIWLCAGVFALYGAHTIWWLAVRGWRREGRLTPNIVVVGATDSTRRLIETMLKTRDAAVLGVFDDRLGRAPGDVLGVPVLGDTKTMLEHRIMPYVDRIVIGVPGNARGRVRQLIEKLSVLPNEITLLTDPESETAVFDRITEAPLAQLSNATSGDARALAKRLQDLALGAFFLIAGLPLMALIALAVKLDSPGPVFFRQRRQGFNNEEIVVWKFRSMRTDATDDKAERQVTAGDERVTRVGKFIRRTSLDELPQLINVLMGEMSLVGPRPHAIGMKTGQVESHRLVAEYAHRHRMKPGLTGWAAINGSRGPVDTPELVRRRVALDIEYIERQSFWLDLYVLGMTLPCLLGDRAQVR